jgi:hypothetical protein
MVAHDPHERMSDRAADESSAEKGTGALTLLQQTLQSALSDPGERHAFVRAVREFTVAARRNGNTAERVIIGLKQELAGVPRVDRKSAAELVAFAVSTSIDEYYNPTTSEFPTT